MGSFGFSACLKELFRIADESTSTPARAKSLRRSLLSMDDVFDTVLYYHIVIAGGCFLFSTTSTPSLGFVTSHTAIVNFENLPTVNFDAFNCSAIFLIVILVCCSRETILAHFLGTISMISGFSIRRLMKIQIYQMSSKIN